MIEETLELLRAYHWKGCSETIEIAKGKNKLPETIKEGLTQLKRAIKWQTKKK
jgi:hypothetical protein